MSGQSCDYEIYFSGPEQPNFRLRDVLLKRIKATPPGGAIDWVTYYFRDRELARELIAAKRRGVAVAVTMAGKPRSSEANLAVIELLSASDGLDDGLRLATPPGLPAPKGRSWRPQLHTKLYCFSHPHPIAFIGSYNPCTDDPELRPDVVAEIGEHKTAYNNLVGITDTKLVALLVRHARFLNNRRTGLFHRFSRQANQVFKGADMQVFLWPRTLKHPVLALLKEVPACGRIRLAASHLRSKKVVRLLKTVARSGVEVEAAVSDSHRRVPVTVEHALSGAGVSVRRIRHPDGHLMHLKFILVEVGDHRRTVFGSYNWTNPSIWLNHELAATSTSPRIYRAFDRQWTLLGRRYRPTAA